DFILISNSLGYGRKPDAAEDNMLTETKLKSPLESISYEMIDVSPDMLKLDSILENTAKQYTNKINDELSKMIQFQLMRNSAVPVSRIYIYGGLSGIRGLDANISQLLSYPVDIIQSVSKVKSNPNVQISKYLNAIGSIIRIK
ncbi:MAG TPA: hypothetical protein VHO66_02515, partial [Ruminiclostridium sp.]|nr:hypothetical protein [Ruminiclostridium sp.]